MIGYRTALHMQPLRSDRDDADCCVSARAEMRHTQPDAAGAGTESQQAAPADQHQAAADLVRVALPLLCLASGFQTKTRRRQIDIAAGGPARY